MMVMREMIAQLPQEAPPPSYDPPMYVPPVEEPPVMPWSVSAARALSMLSLPLPQPEPGEAPPVYKEVDDDDDDRALVAVVNAVDVRDGARAGGQIEDGEAVFE